jgi:hypothetical protein
VTTEREGKRRQVYVCDMATGESTKVFEGPSCDYDAAFSASSEFLFLGWSPKPYNNGEPGYAAVLRQEGAGFSVKHQATLPQANGGVLDATWAPDGDIVVGVMELTGDIMSRDLWKMSSDLQEQRRMGRGRGLSFSPSGHLRAYTQSDRLIVDENAGRVLYKKKIGAWGQTSWLDEHHVAFVRGDAVGWVQTCDRICILDVAKRTIQKTSIWGQGIYLQGVTRIAASPQDAGAE